MARRPRSNVNQLDLFAARPAPGPSMEPRGSIGEPLALGVSHERGTPGLSAIESSRVLASLSIVHTGYRFYDGSSCCRACWEVWAKAGNDRGRGFRMSVYRSREPFALARCAACGVPFPGETAQEELDRRTGKKK